MKGSATSNAQACSAGRGISHHVASPISQSDTDLHMQSGIPKRKRKETSIGLWFGSLFAPVAGPAAAGCVGVYLQVQYTTTSVDGTPDFLQPWESNTARSRLALHQSEWKTVQETLGLGRKGAGRPSTCALEPAAAHGSRFYDWLD